MHRLKVEQIFFSFLLRLSNHHFEIIFVYIRKHQLKNVYFSPFVYTKYYPPKRHTERKETKHNKYVGRMQYTRRHLLFLRVSLSTTFTCKLSGSSFFLVRTKTYFLCVRTGQWWLNSVTLCYRCLMHFWYNLFHLVLLLLRKDTQTPRCIITKHI